MKAAMLLSFLLLFACGHDHKPAEDIRPPAQEPAEEPAGEPDEVEILASPEECEALGGTFKPSIGGPVECDEGTKKIGAVRFGIEGGNCCK